MPENVFLARVRKKKKSRSVLLVFKFVREEDDRALMEDTAIGVSPSTYPESLIRIDEFTSAIFPDRKHVKEVPYGSYPSLFPREIKNSISEKLVDERFNRGATTYIYEPG